MPFVAALAALAIVVSFAISPASAGRVALVGPLTGQGAGMGTAMIAGQKAALDRLNQEGGLLGEPVVFETFDDRCDPAVAAQTAERIAAENFDAVIGHVCSGAALAAAEIYERNDILLVTPGVQAPALTQRSYKAVFRTLPTTDSFARIAAEYGSRLSVKTIAVLESGIPLFRDMAARIVSEAKERGVTVIGPFGIGDGPDGIAVAARQASDENAVLVVMALPTRIAAQAAIAIQEVSPTAVSLILSTLNPEEEQAVFLSAPETVVLSDIPDPREQPSATSAIGWLNERGVPVELPTLYGYAAVHVWAQAVDKAGTFDAAQVSEGLRTQVYDTLLGPLRFGPNGDVADFDYAFYQWRDGRRVALASYRGRPPPPPPPP